MAGLCLVLSWHVVRQLLANPWILTIARDRATRVAHGLEHATLEILYREGVPNVHGFTHGRDRFVIAVPDYGHDPDQIRIAAVSAIMRVSGGERSLAYSPGCGTSEVVSTVTFWLVYVACIVSSFGLGGSVPVFVVISALVLRLWLAFETGLGLLAQRLFTVSTTFASANVVDLREVLGVHGHKPSAGEKWFEIVLDVRIGASEGGFVAPGPLA